MPGRHDEQSDVQRLAAALERDLDRLTPAMLDRLLAEPDMREYDEPHIRALALDIARANLLHEIRCIHAGFALPERCPPEAALAARQAAEMDAPITVVLQCYRAGHAVLWRAWQDLVDRAVARTAARPRLLDRASDFMFAYVDRCSMYVIAEYAYYREQLLRSSDHERLEEVRQVLEGRADLETVGGYPLGDRHLGLVAWGQDAGRVLRTVTAALGPVALVVPGGDGTVWGWVAYRGSLAERKRRLKHVTLDRTALACGTVAPGPKGFSRVHREAQDAHAVAVRQSTEVTFYEDVALEALALSAEDRARDFVELELGPLSDLASRQSELRRTLRMYFAAGQNASAAAAALGVNERTVRNRLAALSEMLGISIADRRVELEAALRFANVVHTERASTWRAG